MKLTLIFTAVSIALVASERWQWEEVRKENVPEKEILPLRDYFYLFDGQLTTGVPHESRQRSATRLQAIITVNIQRYSIAVMKLTKIRIGSANRRLREVNQLIPFDAFEQNEIDRVKKEILHLPLQFKYVKGCVSEIEFDRTDQPWSKNIKRAVLNLLNVNLQQENRTYLHSDTVGYGSYREFGERRTTSDSYEQTVEGNCETVYSFNRSPNSLEIDMEVTKTVNFANCLDRVDIRYNYPDHQVSGSCAKDHSDSEGPLHSSSTYTYGIVSKKENFLIQRAEVKSQYVNAMFGKQGNVVVTDAVSKIELIRAEEGGETTRTAEHDRTESLLYEVDSEAEVERFYMNGEVLSEEDPNFDVQDKVSMVGQTLRRMLRAMRDEEMGTEEEAATQASRLIDVLRISSREDIKKIGEQFYATSEKFREEELGTVRDILTDAMALAATENTLEHLFEKIEGGKVPVLKAVKAIQNLASTRIVSEQHIDLVFHLCEAEVSEENALLKQSCLLTAGSLIHSLCGRTGDRFAVDRIAYERCPSQLKEKYAKILSGYVRYSQSRYEMILALKALGNAGLDASVTEIENIVNNRKFDRVIRMEAVDSLRKLRQIIPHKIQRLLMPIVKNKRELPEVRMKAFALIVRTNPERALLDQIVETLSNEPSRQVNTFVRTLLHSLRASPHLFEKKLAEDLWTSLRSVEVTADRWTDSRYERRSWECREHDTGLALDIAAIFHNDGFLPREFTVGLEAFFGSEWRSYIAQLGFVQHNGEQLLETLWKIVKGRNVTSETFKPHEILHEVCEKFDTHRRSERRKPYAMLSLRYAEEDFAVVPLSESTLPLKWRRLIEKQENHFTPLKRIFSQPYAMNNRFFSFIYESSRRIATSLGIPLLVSGRAPVVYLLKGEIKPEPKPVDDEHSVAVRIRASPQFAIAHVTKVSLRNPIVNSGLKAVHSAKFVFPIDLAIQVNAKQDMELKYTVKVPRREVQLFSAQTRIMTVTSSWPRDAKTFIEPEMKTVTPENVKQRVERIESSFGTELGIPVHVRGHYLKHPSGFIRRLFLNENFLEVTIEPNSDSPREIIGTVVVEQNTKKGITTSQVKSFDVYGDEPKEKNLRSKDVEKGQFGSENDSDKKNYEGGKSSTAILVHNEEVRRQRPQKGLKDDEKALRIHLEVETKGAPVNHHGVFEFSARCDKKLRSCKWLVHGRRSPIFADEHEQWTIKTEIESQYGGDVGSVGSVYEVNEYPAFVATIDSEWGAQHKQTFNATLGAQQTLHPQRLPPTTLPNGIETSTLNNVEQQERATQINYFHITADYQLDTSANSYLNKIFHVIKTNNWPDLEAVNTGRLTKSTTRMQLMVDAHDHRSPTLDIEIGGDRIKVNEAESESATKISSLLRYIYEGSALATGFGGGRRAMCAVHSDRVNTFDGLETEFHISNCYSMIASDCSAQTPTFAVMIKKINSGSDKKMLMVIDKDRVIELERVDERFKVVIDGNEVTEAKDIEDHNISIVKEMAIVELENILVKFNGNSSSLKASALLRNEVCGICGQYDDNVENEENERMMQWELKVNECGVRNRSDQANKNHRIRETVKPILRTKVIEEDGQLCLSKIPVAKCPNSAYTDQQTVIEMEVPFTCLRRDSSEASSVSRSAHSNRLSLEELPEHFTKKIRLPDQCFLF